MNVVHQPFSFHTLQQHLKIFKCTTCTNQAELPLYYEHLYIFKTERVFIGFDSCTSTTLKGSYIMHASRSGEESPEETNGPPKDMTTTTTTTATTTTNKPETDENSPPTHKNIHDHIFFILVHLRAFHIKSHSLPDLSRTPGT